MSSNCFGDFRGVFRGVLRDFLLEVSLNDNTRGGEGNVSGVVGNSVACDPDLVVNLVRDEIGTALRGGGVFKYSSSLSSETSSS